MQHDLFRCYDLDLRSKFQNDLSRSTYKSFDVSRRDEHDAAKSNVMILLSQIYYRKTFFVKTVIFNFCSIEAKPLIL